MHSETSRFYFSLCSAPLSHTSKRPTEISLQMLKGISKILVKMVTIFFTGSDFYCSFLLFSELSNAAILFVQLTILVLSLAFSLLFLGEQKNLFKRLKGLKEEVKARLFLATIPLAENTAAIEMRKQLIGITGYHVSTAAPSSRAMQESNLNHALICACSWESPSSLKALPG